MKNIKRKAAIYKVGSGFYVSFGYERKDTGVFSFSICITPVFRSTEAEAEQVKNDYEKENMTYVKHNLNEILQSVGLN